jgi:hypothetical protein
MPRSWENRGVEWGGVEWGVGDGRVEVMDGRRRAWDIVWIGGGRERIVG